MDYQSIGISLLARGQSPGILGIGVPYVRAALGGKQAPPVCPKPKPATMKLVEIFGMAAQTIYAAR